MNKLSQTIPLLLALTAAPVLAGQNVVVVLDDSGSMSNNMSGDTRMEVAKKALITVLGKLASDAKVGIVCINRGWVYPLQFIDKRKVQLALKDIHPSGGTPLGAYLKVGGDALLELRGKEHYGTYRLLIVTDGEEQDKHLTNRYLPDIVSKGITTDAIGVEMSGNHSLATKVHTYRKADDPASLQKALSEVFAETPDQGDAAQDDFEMIAGLDADIAKQILVALSETVNTPVGEKSQPKLNAKGQVQIDDAGNVVVQDANGFSSGVVLAFIFGIILCVIIVIFVLSWINR